MKTQNCYVSSGDKGYILPMLKNNVRLFDIILDVNDDKSKVNKVNHIKEKWKVKLLQLKFFTDTISDVLKLKELLPKNLYGCSWGYHGFEKLNMVPPKKNI